MFDLTAHPTDKIRNTLASAIDALIAAAEHIQTHYKDIQRRLSIFSNTDRRFPYPTSLKYPNDTVLNFIYANQFQPSRLVYSAKTSKEEVVVKFTQVYSEDVHHFLSNLEMAPTLRGCVRIPGGWYMVMMDKSPYARLRELSLGKADQIKVQSKAAEVVQYLHNGDFVHGDIRDNNILIDPTSLASDEVKLHFIDFDWAGRSGEAKYPLNINTVSVHRPDGDQYHAYITQAHDKEMVQHLFV